MYLLASLTKFAGVDRCITVFQKIQQTSTVNSFKFLVISMVLQHRHGFVCSDTTLDQWLA